MSRGIRLRANLTRVCAIVILGAASCLLAAIPGLADDEPTGFVVLPSESLTLGGPEGRTGEITLLNGTSSPLIVGLTATMQGKDGGSVGATFPDTPDATNITVAAHASVNVKVQADASGTGVLVAAARRPGSSELLAARELALSTATTPIPAPAVTAWPFRDGSLNGGEKSYLPLARACDDAWEDKVVVLAGAGRSVKVTVSCEGETLGLTPAATPPGTYTGKLKLSDTSSVDLTLTRARPFSIAASLVVVGALLAWGIAAARVTRPLGVLRTRLTDATSAVKTAAEKWAEGNPESGVKAAMGYLQPRSIQALTERIDQATPKNKGKPWYTRAGKWLTRSIPAATIKALDESVKSYEADAGRIPEVAAALERLQTANALKGSGILNQKLLDRAKSYFDAKWELDDKTSSEIRALAEVITFANQVSAAKEISQKHSPLADLDMPERAAMLDARAQLESLVLTLGEAKSGADAMGIVDRKLDDELRAIVGVFAAIPMPQSASERYKSLSEQHKADDGSPDGGVATASLWGDLGKTWALLKPVISEVTSRLVNVWAFLIASATAMFAGYLAFYADKPWGSPVDVIAALVYGSTTFAVAISLGRYFGDPVREAIAEGAN